MSSEARVKGLRELHAALQALPAQIERNVMRGALRAGVKVLQTGARARVSVAPPTRKNARLYGGRRGLLRDSVRISVRVRGGRVVARVIAGGKVKGGGIAYYAGWVEKGTRPHVIRSTTGKGLAISTGGGSPVFASQVQHPGARPHPFMTPTFDAEHPEAIRAAAAYIRTRLATKHGVTVPDPGGST